uniref:Uncharacterized protein n=1 Tax=Plectus sambesii TaxID=2011161 RepID=A0A914UWH5_9BILA
MRKAQASGGADYKGLVDAVKAKLIMQANETAANANIVKSKYYKYLESLCHANGINIATIKKDAKEATELEMYFGGLPVLVGLKYFTELRCLRIFGQDIKSLKPLSEVAATLDELWLCEGKLKDISGIESCILLRRLYLYENEIVDGKPLSKLVNLDTLWLMENQLMDLSFLSGMMYLTNLNLASNRLTDKGLKAVQRWPDKLEVVDLSGNDIINYQSIYPLSKCTMLRSVYFRHTAYKPCPLTNNDRYLWWMAYHFQNLESLDDDSVTDTTRAALTVTLKYLLSGGHKSPTHRSNISQYSHKN